MGVKGVVLTLDAIIAMLLMVSIISLLTFYRTESASPFFTTQQLHSLSEDSLSILSESTLREIVTNQTLLSDYISRGILNDTDLDKSAIDVIGMLWSQNRTETDMAAASLSKDILGNILPDNVGYQVLVSDNNVDYNVYNSSDTQRPSYSDSGIEISSGKIASGYQKGENVTGFVARAFLTSIAGKEDSSYVYFGGYVGDGNITANITLPVFAKITEAYMELDTGSSFSLYINGKYSGNYINGTAGGGLMRADKWIVCNSTYNPSYCSNFTVGNNTLRFNFSGNGSFIGGGYFRVTFNTSQLAPEEQVGKDTYWFPGISGFFNLYDSFYVPGTLTNMTSYLHYLNNLTLNQTNATVYLSIGNVKVFRSNKTGEQIVNLSMINFSQSFGSQQNLIGNVSNRTVPLRFGVEGFQAQGGGVGTADAVLVTDVSDSMDTNDVQPGNQDRLFVAKIVDNLFVDTVLNTTGDRVGLSAYSSNPGIRWWHPLSNNNAALKGNISLYQHEEYTCISCGIQNATQTLLTQSNSSRFRGILVMSDGQANVMIPGTCSNCPWWNCGCKGSGYSSEAGGEATQKACDARNSGINATFGIAFGNDADQEQMKRIACWNCSACPNVRLSCTSGWSQSTCTNNGCYYNTTSHNCAIPSQCWINIPPLSNGTQADCISARYAQSNNVDELKGIYGTFGSMFAILGYTTQKANITGNISYNNILYPDSYIQFNYTPVIIPYDYGEVSLTREAPRLGNLTGDTVDKPYKEGWFNISNKVKVVDAKITSYSSDFWTDMLWMNSSATMNWTAVYNLTKYGSDYTPLGDPFIIHMPIDKVSSENNSVRIETATSPANKTGGSPDDRVIYTIRVKGSVNYGDVNKTEQGALSDAIQRLINLVKDYVNVTTDNIQTEANSIGGVSYMWGPADVKVKVWS